MCKHHMTGYGDLRRNKWNMLLGILSAGNSYIYKDLEREGKEERKLESGKNNLNVSEFY